MNTEQILDRVKKLMRLANSPNANEAAAAAAKAQAMIDAYQLDAAILAVQSSDAPTPEEPIRDFYKAGAPLHTSKQLDRWRYYLASTVAKANGCRTYGCGGSIALVGRASDAEIVRVMFDWLHSEIERLTDGYGSGMGRTWRNNFRIGVVDSIAARLTAERTKMLEEKRHDAEAAGSTALVVLNQALARIDARGAQTDQWVKSHLRLHRGGGSSTAFHPSARAEGQRAGQAINLHGTRQPSARRLLA